ncbi:MAG: DUF1573 domain-containing protein [Candidatus Cloacimonetes bacterium]|nr:DUF1573 domain-containing protein [Candidatus Cloacimonadota bacterium]
MRRLFVINFLILLLYIPLQLMPSVGQFQIERNSGTTFLEMTVERTVADSVYHQVFPVIDGDVFCVESSENCQVEMSCVMRMRDMEFSVLSIIPVSGLQSGDLMRVELSGGSENEITFHKPAGSFLRMYAALFPERAERNNWRDIETAQPSILYIYPDIDEPAFWNVFNYLLEWKKQKGFKVYQYATNSTNSTDIKDYIQEAYDTWEEPPEYICIIGDAGGDFSIPAIFCAGGAGDHYYTTLAGDDQISDVHIGRLSFNSISQWQTIVYKITTYEREPYMGDTGWYNRVLLTGDPYNYSGISCVYTNINIRELITNNHSDYVFTEVYEPPFLAGMQNGVNSGVSYFNYRGIWGMSGWNSGTAEYLNNGMMLPFAVISTCETGDFYGEGACRSESFIRAGTTSNPRGGIGAIGTATTQTHTCFNNCFATGVAYGLYVEDLQTMGASHTRGKTSLWLNFPQNPDDKTTKFCYWNNLIGDPAVAIWIGEPRELIVESEEHYSHTQNSISIRVLNEYNSAAEGLYCCLYNSDNDEQHFCFSDEDGYAIFPVADIVADEFTLTVSGKNYYPIQQNIMLDAYQELEIETLSFIDDSGNGSFEPGEAGELNFHLINTSNVDILQVTVTVESFSDAIEIENGTITIDLIEAGEVVILNNISVNYQDETGNNSACFLGINIGSVACSFSDSYQVPLTYLELSLSDYTFSDNNNNIPEPGEIIYFDYEISNTGDCVINDISLSLTSSSNLVIIFENTEFLGGILPGESYQSLIPFEIEIADEYIGGNEETFYINLSSETGFEQVLETRLLIGEGDINEPTGPDAYEYCIYDEHDSEYMEVEYDWIEINTETQLPLTDMGDEGSSCQVQLPFNFRFYDQNYDVLTVCSNGWVKPGFTESSSFMNWTIPGEGGVSPIIAVFWDDLVIGSNSGVYAHYDENDHIFIVEWDNLSNDWSNNEETFELIIYDREYYPSSNGNNEMKFQYKVFNNDNSGNYSGDLADHGQYSTIGIEDQTGTIGLQYTYNNEYPLTGSELGNNSALMISGIPVPDETCWLILADCHYYNNSGEELIVPGDTINVALDLLNIGNEPTGIISISLSCANVTDVELINSDISAFPIAAGCLEEGITGLSFYLGENYPPLESLRLSLNIQCNGMNWNYEINPQVTAPVLSLFDEEIDFGEVFCNFASGYLLEIRNTGTAPLELTGVQISCPGLISDFSPEIIESGETGELLLAYESDEIGTFNGTFTIFSNSITGEATCIPVTGTVVLAPEIIVDQNTQEFSVIADQITECPILISNSGEGSLTVSAGLDGYYNSGKGALFTGGYLNISEPVITGTEFSIEAWARVDGPGFHQYTTNTIFEQRDNTTSNNTCQIVFFASTVSGNIMFHILGNESTGTSLVAQAPPQGEWHHYCGTLNDDFISLYIDGQLAATDFNLEEGSYSQSVENIDIGAHRFNGELKASFNGMIDELRIWDRALSSDEIQENYNHSVSLDSEGLDAYWTFNQMGNWQDLVNDEIEVFPELPVSQITSNAPINDWSRVMNSSLVIDGGESGNLILQIDASFLELGEEYETSLILETNDPEAENITVPVIITVVLTAENENELPVANILKQNYPNPYYANNNDRKATVIEYSLKEEVKQAEIIIYNIKGQKVKGFLLEPDKSRKGMICWDGCNDNNNRVGSGVYCYILKTDGKLSSQRKMLLLH